MSEIPADLPYTAEHEWVQRTGDDTVRVGITDFAQSSLGDVVFVQLPDVGTEVDRGRFVRRGGVDEVGVRPLRARQAKVVAVNGDLEGNPQLVNSDPYGEGWLIELQVDADCAGRRARRLLDADGYRALLTE